MFFDNHLGKWKNGAVDENRNLQDKQKCSGDFFEELNKFNKNGQIL